jgi:hypothetical protein
MKPHAACPGCGCIATSDAHAVLAALRGDDVDAAIDLGLLEAAPCPGCQGDCNVLLLRVRDERRFALSARDRYRARAARLQRRAAEREARRTPPVQVETPAANVPALPPAAAAALARAKAKAAARDRS